MMKPGSIDRRTPLSPDDRIADPRIAVTLWILMLGASAIAFSRLPETVPTHYGFDGTPDAYGSRWVPVALLPGLGGVALGIIAMARRFASTDTGMLVSGLSANIILATFAAIHASILGTLFDLPLNPVAVVTGWMGLVFIVLGRIMPRIAPNPWMGIRTPSTLGSPEVWQRTHERAGPLWVFAGGATIAGALFMPRIWGLLTGLGVVFVVSIEPMIYARRLRRRLEASTPPEPEGAPEV